MLQPGLSVLLPDGLMLADGHEVDGAALAAFLDGPAGRIATGVQASSLKVFWGLNLWLAVSDGGPARSPRTGRRSVRPAGPGRRAARPGAAALGRGAGHDRDRGFRRSRHAYRRPARDDGRRADQFVLEVAGFGPHGPDLGAALAAQVQAWDRAGQPGAARLHVDAYPRSSPDEPPRPATHCELSGPPPGSWCTTRSLGSVTGDHLETEQKYDADADFVLPELGGRRPAAPKRFYLSATYYDTDDLDLIRHKITLRRRVGGDDEGWHLKLPVRKDTRQELHAPLDEGATGASRRGSPLRSRTSRQVTPCVPSPFWIPNGPR